MKINEVEELAAVLWEKDSNKIMEPMYKQGVPKAVSVAVAEVARQSFSYGFMRGFRAGERHADK